MCERGQHAAAGLATDHLCFKLLSLQVLAFYEHIRMRAVAMDRTKPLFMSARANANLDVPSQNHSMPPAANATKVPHIPISRHFPLVVPFSVCA